MRQVQQPTKNGRRRRNFFLLDTLMEEVNQFAEKRGTSMAKVIETALTKYLEAVKRAQTK
jgi:metal-responsive CopG/Arc/MetJ family transcriptional regulator